MTWSHPRGIDPLTACAEDWRRETGVELRWDARSLQDFETFPVRDLARTYDLVVIDHPHVGQVAAEGCLLPLPDAPEIAAGSVGWSFVSYAWEGQQWAWPIDAAAQVQAIRPDVLDAPPRDWDAVVALAQDGLVSVPLRSPHALMCFFTLTANMGAPCCERPGGPLVDRAAGRAALERLREVAALAGRECHEMDPIAVLDAMASNGAIACAPLCYGYVSYAVPGFRAHRLSFHDMPSIRTGGCVEGSALGGTGIAVSALSAQPDAALAFAKYVAYPAVQAGRYVAAGGQAGHLAAWTDPAVDRAAGGFYSGTLATLDGAWLRPRRPGYMAFQGAASEIVSGAVRGGGLDAALDELDRLHAAIPT